MDASCTSSTAMERFFVETSKREELIDITEQVKNIVSKSKKKSGLCNIYLRHASAALMVQENWDDSVQKDILSHLAKAIPQGIWEHDKHDGNADAHIKSGIVGPSETIPFSDGKLLLGKWQNIFLCEFDGPRKREVVVTVLND